MRAPMVRPAAVAGSWYPGTRGALEREVDALLSSATVPVLRDVVAVISPHAGMMYSGGVAAHAYRAVSGSAVDTIVLVGPSHYVGFDGVAIYERGGFETPLGVADIDRDVAAALLSASPLIQPLPSAHAREHSLEMQLPFLSHLAPALPIVPLVMGYQDRATATALGDALASAARERRVLLVASTDLSHYHDANTAAALDRVVADCVARFDPDALQAALERNPEHACGGGPLVAVMRAARIAGARDALVLRYADSGDVSGDKTAVVGYMAAALGIFHPAAPGRA